MQSPRIAGGTISDYDYVGVRYSTESLIGSIAVNGGTYFLSSAHVFNFVGDSVYLINGYDVIGTVVGRTFNEYGDIAKIQLNTGYSIVSIKGSFSNGILPVGTVVYQQGVTTGSIKSGVIEKNDFSGVSGSGFILKDHYETNIAMKNGDSGGALMTKLATNYYTYGVIRGGDGDSYTASCKLKYAP